MEPVTQTPKHPNAADAKCHIGGGGKRLYTLLENPTSGEIRIPNSKAKVGPVICLIAAAISMSPAETGAQTHGHSAGHGHGHQHDMVNMPGLKGENATSQESDELAAMFRGFENISREVENLPNGIRTVTYSPDPELMDIIISHVTGMITRVETGNDPMIFIQSPTLDIFFARGDRFETDIEVTDAGIVVTQTADDPDLVAALHVHAAEVTAMVDEGMEAVHKMMMQRAGN